MNTPEQWAKHLDDLVGPSHDYAKAQFKSVVSQAIAQAVQREREAAREVLQFYANGSNWLNIYVESGMRWPMVEDSGKKARALLSTYNNNKKG